MTLNVLGGNVPSIVNPLPFGIIPQQGLYSSQYQRSDESYDYAIAGLPFLSGESLRGTYFRRMYLREFAQIRKDQFDNQQVPGEQSILGWWLRSQSLFAQGAGIQYLDTTVDQTVAQRFAYSEHMDMLTTPGAVSLLQASKQVLVSASTNLALRGVSTGGTDYVLVADGAVLKLINAAGAVTIITMPAGTGTIVSITDDGTNYYFADATTGIYKGALATPATAATKVWNLPSTSGRSVISWVKGRLVAGLDNSVYELTGSGPALPTPKFSHLNAAYTFTAISQIPSAILTAGAAGALSQIHRFTLDTGGALPTLTSGTVDAEMPVGEVVNDLYAYAGTFVGIATGKGVRIGQTDSSGNLVYGPLVVLNPNGVNALSGYDRFMFAGSTNNAAAPYNGWTNPDGASSTSCLVRMDLSTTTSSGGQPWCNDMDSHFTGAVLDTCNFGTSAAGAGMIAMSVAGQGVFITDPATKESQGLLYTGRIRYNTLEPKHFKYAYMRTQSISDGSIALSALDPSGGTTSIITQGSGTTTSPVLIGPEGNAVEWLQLKFLFSRGINNTNYSPILNGYQLRALPGVDRQLLLTLPLSCHDFEEDKYGNPVGYDGAANYRLNALESLIQSGNLVMIQDLNYNTAALAVIDNYRFEQQANEQPKAASAGNADSNARGGYIIVQARIVQ